MWLKILTPRLIRSISLSSHISHLALTSHLSPYHTFPQLVKGDSQETPLLTSAALALKTLLYLSATSHSLARLAEHTNHSHEVTRPSIHRHHRSKIVSEHTHRSIVSYRHVYAFVSYTFVSIHRIHTLCTASVFHQGSSFVIVHALISSAAHSLVPPVFTSSLHFITPCQCGIQIQTIRHLAPLRSIFI